MEDGGVDSQSIGDVAENKRNGDLYEEANRRKSVAGKRLKPEAPNDGWTVSIESAERAVVTQSDQNVNPEPPVGELEVWRISMGCYICREIAAVLTAFLKESIPICCFFLSFRGSSKITRILRMCNSLSLKILH